MIPDVLPGWFGAVEAGIVLFVLGVFWRGWSERSYTRAGLGGVVVHETVYSIWADVLLAAGIALFAYGVLT